MTENLQTGFRRGKPRPRRRKFYSPLDICHISAKWQMESGASKEKARRRCEVTRYDSRRWGRRPGRRIRQCFLSAHPEGLVVGDIQGDLEIPNSTLSHHLDKLKNEWLVQRAAQESPFCGHRKHGKRAGSAAISLFGCCTRNKGPQTADIRSLHVGGTDGSTAIKGNCKERKKTGRRGQRGKAGVVAGRLIRTAHWTLTSNRSTARAMQQVPESAASFLGCGNQTARQAKSPAERGPRSGPAEWHKSAFRKAVGPAGQSVRLGL